jgi:phage-related protein
VEGNFIRKTKVYRNHFWDFYNAQTEAVKDKIDWVISLVRTLQQVPEKYLKHMEGTDSIFEIRVSFGNNIFRIFCCFDEGQLVILFNGFQKKTQKTPKNEIKKAVELQKQYYEDKKAGNLN